MRVNNTLYKRNLLYPDEMVSISKWLTRSSDIHYMNFIGSMNVVHSKIYGTIAINLECSRIESEYSCIVPVCKI